MSCNDGGGCGSCEDCPEKQEAKKQMALWKSIFTKALQADGGEGRLLSPEEEALVKKTLEGFPE
jgi:hypothetical protein